MAKLRAGDITQLILFNRIFEVMGDSDVTYRLNGRTNANAPTGSGGMHTTQRLKLGGFDSVPISNNTSKEDLEYLQECADDGEPGNCSITLIDGTVYGGDLSIEGDIDASSGSGQIEITAYGPKFEMI